jgi:lipocalin-like protein
MLRFALAASLAPASTVAQPACAVDLVGTWQLVSIATWGADGKRNDAPFGKGTTGMFIFSADGHTSVIISYGDRKKLGSVDRLAGSVQQKAEAFDSSFGYSGRYTCSGDRVVVRVTHSSVPDWVGTEMVRLIKLAGGKLTISTPPFVVGGTSSAWELVWERAK